MRYILVTFTIEREGDQFVSKCVELGTASCGDSEQEALDNILDATELYLNMLNDLGESEGELAQKGVIIRESESVGPALRCPPGRRVHPAVFPLPMAASA